MAIMSNVPWCDEHDTDDFIWHTQQGHYQCDACWDDTASVLFGIERQYTKPITRKENA